MARSSYRIEHADCGGERECQFLHRRRASFLEVIGADIDRIPFRHFLGREQDHVLGQPHRRRRRKHIGAARQIFLDDVVLRRALQLGARHALLVGERNIEREQPGGRRIDCHRRVHLAERDRLEQRAHIAEMTDRHANLAAAYAMRRHIMLSGDRFRRLFDAVKNQGEDADGMALEA